MIGCRPPSKGVGMLIHAMPDLTREGVTWLVVPANDVEFLGRRRRELMAFPAAASQMEAAGRAEARHRFTCDAVALACLCGHQEFPQSVERLAAAP